MYRSGSVARGTASCLPARIASAIPDNPRVSPSSSRRLIKPVSLSRFRVETTISRRTVVGAAERVEDFFFILVVVWHVGILKTPETVGFTAGGRNFVE